MIWHQLRLENPDIGEDKHIDIGITNPHEDQNEITKDFKIALKLDDLPTQEVYLRDAFNSVHKKTYMGTDIQVTYTYDRYNQLRIDFKGTSPTIDQKFKEGNKIEITISGPCYEKCTKVDTIPMQKNWPS